MKLPHLLAGPILRRVDKNEVFIWTATSHPYKVNADLYEINRNQKSDSYQYHPFRIRTVTKTIQMGRRMFIHLIKIEPEETSFPTQTLLGYNLHFMKNSKTKDLGTFGLLSHGSLNSIVYGKLKYPTFFINEKENSTILYGSCRKPHGEGEDALAQGDGVIEKTYLNPDHRPGSLFLIGDQIYADDVADPFIPFIYKLGEKLIGEKGGNLADLDGRLKKDPYLSNLDKIQGRKLIMDDLCHFTSRKGDNHLITLGEYAAMYLLSWNPDIWERFNKESYKNLHKGSLYSSHDAINEKRNIQSTTYAGAKQEKKIKDQERLLEKFNRTLPRIRRLLANIPTYMIFDDHDVTDDWNISLEWKQRVWEAPLGSHVIANGLAAYWAFQAWGNEPSAFNEEFLTIMTNQFSSMKLTGKSYKKWINLLWGFDSWSFVAPTKPTTVFLDTRTQRNYCFSNHKSIRKSINQTMEGPELISETAWKRISEQLHNSGWKPKSPLMIVSPVPLYGIDLIETFLSQYIAPLKLVGIPVKTIFDMEAWKYNGQGFTRFLRAVSEWDPSLCIILSGDAHTASSVISSINGEGGKKMDILQFTSSPLHNPTFSGLPGVLLKGAVMLFETSSERASISRHCHSDFTLCQSIGTKPSPTSNSLWSENIRYLPLENESIIKTKNNLGLLTFTDENKLNNQFLEGK